MTIGRETMCELSLGGHDSLLLSLCNLSEVTLVEGRLQSSFNCRCFSSYWDCQMVPTVLQWLVNSSNRSSIEISAVVHDVFV